MVSGTSIERGSILTWDHSKVFQVHLRSVPARIRDGVYSLALANKIQPPQITNRWGKWHHGAKFQLEENSNWRLKWTWLMAIWDLWQSLSSIWVEENVTLRMDIKDESHLKSTESWSVLWFKVVTAKPVSLMDLLFAWIPFQLIGNTYRWAHESTGMHFPAYISLSLIPKGDSKAYRPPVKGRAS